MCVCMCVRVCVCYSLQGEGNVVTQKHQGKLSLHTTDIAE